ncbi:MAG: tyrosine-type recombinase/integrase [Actinobacteria bacterium]|nr:tyrosine-type recombinase/integrase [Actinomycetota bacterium]
MARPVKGSIESIPLVGGSHAFHLRFPAYGERERVILHEREDCECCGGGWDERAARQYLGTALAQVRAGVWEPPAPAAEPEDADEGPPLYVDYSEHWLAARVAGIICKKPIAPNTRKKDEWRLGYSQRFFAGVLVEEIDEDQCLEFKGHLLAEAQEQREAIEAGAELRDETGRKIKPLSLGSIKMILDTLASVLDEAIRDKHRTDNPGRSKRMHVEVPKPVRTYLELDELAALLDAAGEQELGLLDLASVAAEPGSSAERVARLVAAGKRPKQITIELGLSNATVTYHLRRLGVCFGRGYIGRRAVCELLARAGVRASELCDLKIGQVRLHDPEGARLRILDSKTEAGVRIVEITPELAEVIVEHIDRLRRSGMPCGSDDYLVPNVRGGRMSRQRVGKIVAAAAEQASKRLRAKGLPPLPHTTPHTLRRTYISIALLANEFDVKFVMAQVGHADSKMTMEVYAQLQQRVERRHGERFDALVQRARKQLAGVATGS